MKPITYVLLLCATLLSSCDDGRIAEEDFNLKEEGRVAKVKVKLEGQKTWPSGYSISIAGFSDNSPYAEITKSIRTDENGQADVTLSGIPDNVKTLEVCVVNSVRRASSLSSPSTRLTRTTRFASTQARSTPACLPAYRNKFSTNNVPTATAVAPGRHRST